MRNPVGPLPSSIYWRRRAVVLCLVALLALPIAWIVNSNGRDGGGTGASGPSGHGPASSITPGPAPSGSHISGRPGGRDTSPGRTPSDGASGSGGSADSAGGATQGSSSGSGSGGDTSGGAGDGGAQLPAGSTLPDCARSAVQLTLRSVKNSYAPGDRPMFELRASNNGGTACAMDFGPTAAVFTVTDTAGGTHVWAGDDCPAHRGAHLLQVPAHSSTTYTVEWNREKSSPDCATPKERQAATGRTYLVEAKLPGFETKQASFVLSAS